MRLLSPFRLLCVASALTVFTGCSSGSAPAPELSAPQGRAHSMLAGVPVLARSIGIFRVDRQAGRHIKSFNKCPAAGPIVYMSDFNFNVVNIYTVPFAGQQPCGQIFGTFNNPQGLFVWKNHDLYVASSGTFDVQVFHRRALKPYNRYTDTVNGAQFPGDVTVAKDGTVIASNLLQSNYQEGGSISTWIRGGHGGTFVGNFPMTNAYYGMFVTVQKDGTLYFNDVDSNTGYGPIWTGACPLGLCGSFTSTGAVAAFPGGLRSADNEDVVQLDQTGLTLTTFEHFPHGRSCSLSGEADPVGFDINRREHHVFVADSNLNVGVELTYPGCVLIGTVPGNPGGVPIGIAKDYPEPLH
jgi:hypothetical protein